MTQINWEFTDNARVGGYIVTATNWNDLAGSLRSFIDQTTSAASDATPLPIGIDLLNDRVYISDPDTTTPEAANHAATVLSVVGATTLAGNLTWDSTTLSNLITSAEGFAKDDASLATGLAISNYIATVASPAGSDGYIQYKNGSVFGGEAELFWDDTNNRLGVGTTTPLEQVEIAGVNDRTALRLSGDGGSGSVTGKVYLGMHQWSSGANPSVRIGAEEISVSNYDADLVFQTRDSGSDVLPTTRMTITSAGKVGIGTTAPAYPLTVSDGSSAGMFQFDPAGLRIGSNHDGYEFSIVGGIPDGTSMGGQVRLGAASRGDGDVNVIQFLQNGTERMRIDNGGNVGIGTATPAYDLDITGNNIRLGDYTTLGRTASGAASVFGHNVHVSPTVANTLVSTNTGYYGQAIRMYYDNGIAFHCASSTVTAGATFWDSSTTGTERMRIGNDGVVSVKVNGVNECMKVMLGSDLHDSTGDSDTEYGAVGFAAAGVFIDRNWMGQPGITVLNSNAAGSSASSQSTFRIHGSNQSWSSYPSDSGSDFAVDLTIDGSTYGTSDERRKTNIEDITDALAMVNNMRGRTFNTINSSLEVEDSKTLGGKKYGFVAQEVMDIVPNAVMKDDAAVPLENGWCRAYLLDYSSLTAVIVEAIKELSARIETLEAP